MDKPGILQIGAYPKWDMPALLERFAIHPLYEVQDKAHFVAGSVDQIRGIATRGELGASRELIESLPNLEIVSACDSAYY